MFKIVPDNFVPYNEVLALSVVAQRGGAFYKNKTSMQALKPDFMIFFANHGILME
jgi:hypothetical protein